MEKAGIYILPGVAKPVAKSEVNGISRVLIRGRPCTMNTQEPVLGSCVPHRGLKQQGRVMLTRENRTLLIFIIFAKFVMNHAIRGHRFML